MRCTSLSIRRSAEKLLNVLAGTAVAYAAFACNGREARAENEFSVDAEVAFPSEEQHDNGWGIGARFGHEWDLVLVELTPEIGVNYHAFGPATDAESFAVLAGA